MRETRWPTPSCVAEEGSEEEGDEAADEAVEEAGLRQGEAEPLGGSDFVAHLGLAGRGLDNRAEERTDTGTRAGRTAARTDAERDRPAGLLAVGGGVNAGLSGSVDRLQNLRHC